MMYKNKDCRFPSISLQELRKALIKRKAADMLVPTKAEVGAGVETPPMKKVP